MVIDNLIEESVQSFQSSDEDVLVKADHVSKKFCRNLKKALWYGVQDIGSEIIGRKYDHQLRPDEFWAVNDISFEVKRGECLGLIGPNGAGKSTLLKMLNGLIKPDKGRIIIRGRVAALIELTAGFNPILTGLENIYNRAAILGLSKAEVDRKLDDIIEFAEIGDFLHTPVQNYSSGMNVRLGFAVAAQLEPDVLILDEVLAVGDVGFQAKCFNRIHQLMQNAAVIFVSHSMPQLARVATKLCLLQQGKIEFLGQDIARGIDIFYSNFQGEEGGLVSSSGDVTVHEIELESKGIKGVNEISFLDELKLHLSMTINSEIKSPNIGFTIMSQSLQPVAQCHSNFQEIPIKNDGNEIKVVVDLDKINLNPGIYSLTLSIQTEEMGKVLLKYYNFKKFKVVGNYFSHAPFILVGSWQVTKNHKDRSLQQGKNLNNHERT